MRSNKTITLIKADINIRKKLEEWHPGLHIVLEFTMRDSGKCVGCSKGFYEQNTQLVLFICKSRLDLEMKEHFNV